MLFDETGWEADGSRSSRRVYDVKVKKGCGGDIGSDGFDGVDGGFDGSMVLMAPRAMMVLASAALKAPKAWGVSFEME